MSATSRPGAQALKVGIIYAFLLAPMIGLPAGCGVHALYASHQDFAGRRVAAPATPLADPFQGHRRLPTLKKAAPVTVIGPTWSRKDEVQVLSNPSLGFAYRVPEHWYCTAPDLDGGAFGYACSALGKDPAKPNGSAYVIVLPCPDGCRGPAREKAESNTLRRKGFAHGPALRTFDKTTRFASWRDAGRYRLLLTHTFGNRYVAVAAEGKPDSPPRSKRSPMTY